MKRLKVFCFVLLVICGCEDSLGPLHVTMFYAPGGKGDRSWNDSGYMGLLESREKLGAKISEYAPVNDADAVDVVHHNLSLPLNNRRELVVTLAYTYTEIVNKLNCRLNGRKLLHFEERIDSCDNVKSVEYYTYAASFLAGVAAMKISETKKAAAIGGLRIPPVVEFIQGFKEGVEWAGGEVIEIQYIPANRDGFNNPEEGAIRAKKLYEKCDVVFPVAGSTGNGVIEYAKTLKDKYVIGVDTDQSWMGKNVVIGSVVKNLYKFIVQAAKEVEKDDFKGGHEIKGMDEGFSEFVVNELFADEITNELEQARQTAIEAEKAYVEKL